MKRKFIILSIIISVSIFLIIGAYVLNFLRYDISNEPSDWGAFSDYIGGLVNPIISIASLVVLGYLTFIISKQGNEENRMLFILEKKLIAYEEFTKHFKEINLIFKRINDTLTVVNLRRELEPEREGMHVSEGLIELSKITSTYSDFYFTLFSFNVKYGHLFKYNFSSEQYDKLLKEVSELRNRYDSISKNIIERNGEELKAENLLPNDGLKETLLTVINSLREEISLPNKV